MYDKMDSNLVSPPFRFVRIYFIYWIIYYGKLIDDDNSIVRILRV